MISALINWLAIIVVKVIEMTGYTGVFVLMLLESCGIPFPSEITMPFAGFLVVDGKMNFWLIVLMGTIGNLVGSLLAYYIALKGGRPLLDKYGKYILIRHEDLDKADHWFSKYGEVTTFVGRLLPVVRTYISFPAGIAKMDVKKFSFYTFIGAFPWCFLFTWLGVKLGSHWSLVKEKLHSLDILMIIAILALVGWYVYKHLKRKSMSINENSKIGN